MDIHVCSVPITPVNQIDCQNLTEQANYFRSKVVQAYTNCNYVYRSGVMRVKGYVDKLNNCNYGFYTNTYIKNYFTNYKINIDIIYKITKKFNIRLGTDFIYMYSKKDTIYSDYHGIMAETNQKGCGNNTSIKINLGCLFKIK